MGDCSEALPVLQEGASQLGIVLSKEQCAQFVRYCHLLHTANQAVNLTAIRTEEGIMRTLFLDSLTLAPALPSDLLERPSRAVDVGSGAGIPGLPLRIAFPSWHLTLIDSVAKKTRFLREAVSSLDLKDTDVLTVRAEDAGREHALRDSADLCTARAVAPLGSLIELCAPFVRPGGLLAFPKSGEIEGELEAARPAAAALRVALHEVRPVSRGLGLGDGRVTVIYVKKERTPSGYPRRTGLARSHPIREGVDRARPGATESV